MFIAVVGPSGAGKGTILNGARASLADDARFVFARRIITRAADQHEESETLSPQDFEAQKAAGAFALHWQANDLSYALPRAILDDVAAGRCVVANISRLSVPDARACFSRTIVIEIRVDPALLAARLARRGREETADQSARLARSAIAGAGLSPDYVIANDGAPEMAIEAFVTTLTELAGQS